MKKTLLLLGPALLAGGIAMAQDHPRVETFFGYTYTRVNSATNVPAFSANGGSFQVAINANKWFGFVGDIGAVHNGNISDVHLDTTMTNFLFGPRINLRYSRVKPYFNVLFGGVYGSTSAGLSALPTASQPIYLPGTTPTNGAVTLRASASETAFAMTTGGGLDIKISRHVSFRPIGLDYFMTRLQNLRTKGDNNQHDIRYTTGFNFTFGGEAPAPPPPPPPMRTCWNGNTVPMSAECPKRDMDLRLSFAQTDLCAGDTVTVKPAAALPDGATYQWTIEGQPISKDASLQFGTTGREPGTYKVGLVAQAPEYNDATAAGTITVRGYRQPTGSLMASPSEIWAGEKARLTADFRSGECGGNLGAPTFTASEGSISGNEFDSSEVRFDPGVTSEQRKTVTIVAKVADSKGAGTAQAALVVKKPAAIVATRLPDIVFPNGNARVNNCGKRVLLEQLKTLMESNPSGKVVLVGHLGQKEADKKELDQKRALNAAAVISAGQGICLAFPAAQILVSEAGAVDNGVEFNSNFCGSTAELPRSVVRESDTEAKYRRVEVWFVPAGGMLPASVKDYKDAASLGVSNLGCPR